MFLQKEQQRTLSSMQMQYGCLKRMAGDLLIISHMGLTSQLNVYLGIYLQITKDMHLKQ
jgi:hypothetical protein